jgi:hypothetical protein
VARLYVARRAARDYREDVPRWLLLPVLITGHFGFAGRGGGALRGVMWCAWRGCVVWVCRQRGRSTLVLARADHSPPAHACTCAHNTRAAAFLALAVLFFKDAGGVDDVEHGSSMVANALLQLQANTGLRAILLIIGLLLVTYGENFRHLEGVGAGQRACLR